jgi:phage shock protein C
MNERLYRSRSDRMVAGVAGGLAEIWNLDPSIVRIVWAVLVPLTGFIALLVYVVMAIVVPQEEDAGWVPPAASPAAASAPQEGGASAAADTPPTGDSSATSEIRSPAMTRAEWRAQRRSEHAARRQERGPGSGAVVLGVALVVIGAYFLLREYVPAFDPDRFWPIALIALGVLLLIVAMGRRPGSGGTSG